MKRTAFYERAPQLGLSILQFRMCRYIPRRAGGCLNTPPAVFRRYLKNGGAERRRFWHTCSCIFSAHVVKISDPGHLRSGHQVTPSDLTSEKIRMLVIATPIDRLP